MWSLADQLLEFFSCQNESELARTHAFQAQYIQNLVRFYNDQRDAKLWSTALNTDCTFLRLSRLDAYEYIAEHGPSSSVKLFDSTGKRIKYPRLPLAIVLMKAKEDALETYVLLEQLL